MDTFEGSNGGRKMKDVVIIGGGVIGCLVGRELSKYDLDVLLLEKENDIANVTTKANSAIVHAGYDAEPGSLKARYNVRGNALYGDLCDALNVPFNRIGSLVLAFDDSELVTIKELYDKGKINGVPDMEILDAAAVRKLEPNVSEKVMGALHARSAGIVGPWELAIAAAENAADNGMEIMLEQTVNNIERTTYGYRVMTDEQSIETRTVINCAGIHADAIHNMVAEPAFHIIPRRGEYYVMDRGVGDHVGSVMFQCPNKEGKGVLVVPTVHGNLLVGPNAEAVDGKDHFETTAAGLEFVWEKGVKTTPKLSKGAVITSFAGLRATPSTGDFIVGEVKDTEGFFDVAGIESPGLSAAPAIAEAVSGMVVERLEAIKGHVGVNDGFNPERRGAYHFIDQPDEVKKSLIAKDPRFGRIICRCENITEAEIVDAIHRNAGGRTLDGIKRRARPGTGRCQGGFCGPRVMEILARELEKDMTEILKDGKDAYVLTHKTKNSGQEV